MTQQTKKETQWVKIERGEIEKWEERKVVEGVYLGMKSIQGNFGPSPIAKMRDSENVIRSLNCPAILLAYLEYIAVGAVIRIECTGQNVPTSGGTMAYGFDVYQAGGELPF